jgi:nicotinate-nucleotide pyrophosphorylase (carboxylating)
MKIDEFPREAARKLLKIALQEDVQNGDVTSLWTIPPELNRKAVLIAKEDGVIAGLPIIEMVYDELGVTVQIKLLKKEGEALQKGDLIAEIEGPVQALLTGERTILNFIQQLSGVATITRTYVQAVQNPVTQILDTRKTLPGFRELQKYAVRLGGAKNHRMGLYDMVLIKDNHIQAAGGVLQAVQAVQAKNANEIQNFNSDDSHSPLEGKDKLAIEIEVETLEQLQSLMGQGLDQIMLDNMDNNTMKAAVQMVRDFKDPVKLEASGNMTLERIQTMAEVEVDYISVGALTHSVKALDISMRIPT